MNDATGACLLCRPAAHRRRAGCLYSSDLDAVQHNCLKFITNISLEL